MGTGERVRERMAALLPDATQATVAARAGMTADAFSRALNGQRQFAAIEIARLAEVLDTSMHWLVTGQQDPHEPRIAARHTFNHESRRHEAPDLETESGELQAIATAYLQLAAQGGAAGNADVPPNPDEARATLQAAVGADFVRRFAEGVENAFGIGLVRVPAVSRGYSMLVSGHRVIVVGQHPNWFFQNWSIAHELGHFATAQIPDSLADGIVSAPSEARANAYAAELLMPEVGVRAIDWSNIDAEALADVLWDWGVSTDAVRRRLAALGIVPADSVREMLALTTQRALRLSTRFAQSAGIDEIAERMERASTRRFPTGLLAAHSEGVSTGLLSAAFLAWMLDVDAATLESELAPPVGDVDLDWLASELGVAHGDPR